MSTPQPGDSIWIDNPTEMFVLAKVAEVRRDGRLVAKVGARKEIVGPPFHPYNQIDSTLEDLVQMLNVDTPNILNTLQARLMAHMRVLKSRHQQVELQGETPTRITYSNLKKLDCEECCK